MALSPKEYARAYYLAVRDKPKPEVVKTAARLTSLLKERGVVRLLPQILRALPAAIEDADSDRRVTIESASTLTDATVAAILSAIGADDAETVRVVSPELLGGFTIKRKDSIIDVSVRGKLAKLRQGLKG